MENNEIVPLPFMYKRINIFNVEEKAVRIQGADIGDCLCGIKIEKVFLKKT